jgi:hypothetical protein
MLVSREAIILRLCLVDRRKAEKYQGKVEQGCGLAKVKVVAARNIVVHFGRNHRDCASNVHLSAAGYYLLLSCWYSLSLKPRLWAGYRSWSTDQKTGSLLFQSGYFSPMDVVKAVETYVTKLVSVPSAMKVLLLDTHTVCSEAAVIYLVSEMSSFNQ